MYISVMKAWDSPGRFVGHSSVISLGEGATSSLYAEELK